VPLALLGLGVAVRMMDGWQPLLASVLVAAGLFLALVALHARGLIGGGDAKLIAALAAGLAPLDTLNLVVATGLVGGVLGALYMILPRLMPAASLARPMRPVPAMRRVASVEAWRIRRRGPLPYGIAIALGGSLVLLHVPGS
jgi:prepilin peptidase CpaA